jgi:hypothetical protein
MFQPQRVIFRLKYFRKHILTVFEFLVLVNNPSLYSCKYCYNYNIKIVDQATALLQILSKLNSHVFLRQAQRYLQQPETYSRNKYYRQLSCVDSSLFFYCVT